MLFCNEQEACALTGQSTAHEACRALGKQCERAVVMVGEKGSWSSERGQLMHHPVLPLEPLDTTGAGDLYAAGYLHGYLQGASSSLSAQIGSLLASHVVQVIGAEIQAARWQKIEQQL